MAGIAHTTGPLTRLVMALALAALLLLLPLSCKKPKPPPPPEVVVAPVIQREVPIRREWVATLTGLVNAVIKPQITGYLIQQDYLEGSLVKKGQVMFEIDPRPFQAALDRANANVVQYQAQQENAQENPCPGRAPHRPAGAQQKGPGQCPDRSASMPGARRNNAGNTNFVAPAATRMIKEEGKR